MIRRTSARRSRTAAWLAAVVILCSAASVARAVDHPPSWKWFKYSQDIERTWDVASDATNPMYVSILRKGAAAPTKRVVVLYPRPSSAYDIAITEILRTFAAKDINSLVEIINFELKDDLGKAALKEAEKNKVDLIFAMGSESAAWLFENYKGGTVPVVTVCSKDPVQLGQMKDYESGSGNNFAFTSLNVPVDVQMAYVHELTPNLKNLAVLVDMKNISAVQTQAEPVAKYLQAQGVNVIWGSVQDPNNARGELEKIMPDVMQAMRKSDPDLSKSLFWITGSTSVFREIKTINRFSGRVPVVSVVPEIVTKGHDTAALAIGVSFESNARLAAIYGAQVLGGADAGKMKVGLVSPPDMAISFAKTREIGMRVPFSFFEIASFVYDYNGDAARAAPQAKDN